MKQLKDYFTQVYGLLQQERCEEALKEVESLLKICLGGFYDDELIICAYSYKGAALYGLGNYEDAVKCYEEALKICPQYSYPDYYERLHTLRAPCYRALKQYEQAIEACNKVLEISPHDIGSLKDKASCLIKLKKYDDAHDILSDIIRISPQDFSAHLHLFNVFLNRTLYDKALEQSEVLIRLHPQNGLSYDAKAVVLIRLKRWKEAQVVIEEGIKREPKNSELYYRVNSLSLRRKT